MENRTIENLIDHHLQKLEKEQEKKNHRSILNRYLKHLEEALTSPIKAVFGPDFQSKSNDFLSSSGNKKGTVAVAKSILKRWFLSSEELERIQELPSDFGKAIDCLIKSSGKTACKIAADLGMPGNKVSLYHWIANKVYPNEKSLPFIEKLEEYFELVKGTLTSKIRHLIQDASRTGTAPTIAYRERLKRLSKLPFRIDPKKVPRLNGEWKGYFKFKTDLQPIGLKRNERWRITTEGCASGERYLSALSSFFGFCHLPRIPATKGEFCEEMKGLGMAVNTLSLTLLTDSQIANQYIEFLKVRAGGVYNSSVTFFLGMCLELTREETGYLWQQPSFAQKIPRNVWAKWCRKAAHRNVYLSNRSQGWHEWCKENRENIAALRRTLVRDKLIKMSRDPKEPISRILAELHPLDILRTMIERIKDHAPFPTACNRTKAIYHRNLLLVSLLVAVPLRIKHFRIMRYHPHRIENLYKTKDGVWRIRYQKDDFKNERYLKEDIFDVPLPSSTWQLIETYLLEFRPFLKGADTSDFVFIVGDTKASASNPTGQMRTKDLSGIIFNLSKKYIPECPGFSAHALRHIDPSDYLKNNPQDYSTAATMLNDSITTVMKNYRHIETEESFSRWNEYHETSEERLHEAKDSAEAAPKWTKEEYEEYQRLKREKLRNSSNGSAKAKKPAKKIKAPSGIRIGTN